MARRAARDRLASDGCVGDPARRLRDRRRGPSCSNLGAVAFRKDLVTLSPEALDRLTSLGVTRAAFSQLIGWLELGFVLTSAGIGCAIFLGKTRGCTARSSG
jgi:hypothetical protein